MLMQFLHKMSNIRFFVAKAQLEKLIFTPTRSIDYLINKLHGSLCNE